MTTHTAVQPELARQKIIRAWVAALRSGVYPQGRHALRSKGRYCVLGVLCDLAGGGEWLPPGGSVSDRYRDPANGKSHVGTLTYGLTKLLGGWAHGGCNWGKVPPALYARLLEITPVHPGLELSDLNDAGVPFTTLADLIETTMLPAGMEPDANDSDSDCCTDACQAGLEAVV